MWVYLWVDLYFIWISLSLVLIWTWSHIAIEIANIRGWPLLWDEIDSHLVTLAFKNVTMVPWHLRTRWLNCIELTKKMSFFISHIYREDNQCIDGFANIGLHIPRSQWWDTIPVTIGNVFTRNRIGLLEYRFC
jgi:hypothetical protein